MNQPFPPPCFQPLSKQGGKAANSADLITSKTTANEAHNRVLHRSERRFLTIWNLEIVEKEGSRERSKGVLSNGALLITQYYHSLIARAPRTYLCLTFSSDFGIWTPKNKEEIVQKEWSRERSKRVLSNGAPLIIRTYHISSLEPLKFIRFSAKKASTYAAVKTRDLTNKWFKWSYNLPLWF